MSSAYFISDLHLDADRPALTVTLAHFLRTISDCDSLYILGDLFEAWIGDDDDSDLASEVAGYLRAFRDSGAKLFLMQGNRDFLLGESYSERCGAVLLDDPTVIDLYGRPALLMHGDTLCTADTDYQAFRRTVRNPAWQARTLNLPLEERRTLARQLRRESLDATRDKAQDIMDVTISEVDSAISDHRVDLLIHGHTHRPAIHELDCGE
ncbi:MAG: UDP-2,3-diacylglucosamine diphosphatase, partial [Halioglobus sp.]